MDIKLFTKIDINFSIIRKISKAEKLFAPKQEEIQVWYFWFFYFYKKVICHGKINTFQRYVR